MKLFVVLLALFMTVYCQEDAGYVEDGADESAAEDSGWNGGEEDGWNDGEDDGWNDGEDGSWDDDEYMSGCSSYGYSATAAIFIVGVLGEFF